MVWVLRDRADKDAYAPREHPDYSAAPDLFTIKLHHGGKFMENPKRYVGGSVDYVDLCDADTMSLIELMTMSKECGDLGAVITHYYKHPNTDMERGLWMLESDSDVVDMCTSDVHNPTPSVEKPSGTAKRASNPNEGTNAGVLKKKADHVKVNNTPLGIQPQQGGSGSKTSRENIEAKRREMQAKLKKNPVWKI